MVNQMLLLVGGERYLIRSAVKVLLTFHRLVVAFVEEMIAHGIPLKSKVERRY